MFKILCDTCGCDLSETTNSIDYRILLKNEVIGCRPGHVTDMMVYPPLPPGELHFCSTNHLKQFLEKL